MKFYFYIFTLCVCFTGCKKELESAKIEESKHSLTYNDNEEGVLMLNKFYESFYFDDNIKIDQSKRTLFISETLLNRIDSLRSDDNFILDYDPFIKGQDFNGESIKNTLEIVPLKNKNQFRASFILFGNKNEKRTNVDYSLIKNKEGKFLISSIINDKYLNIMNLGHAFISNKKVTSSEIAISLQGFELLFNHKLIGLSIIDEQEKDLYKRYGLDFSTICVCDSPSMYIDVNSKELIVFNYCESNESMINIENKTIFKIKKIENEGNKISITSSPYLKLTFKKVVEFPVFQMQVEGNFPTEYVGNALKKNFTSNPEKFKKIECGDFGG